MFPYHYNDKTKLDLFKKKFQSKIMSIDYREVNFQKIPDVKKNGNQMNFVDSKNFIEDQDSETEESCGVCKIF